MERCPDQRVLIPYRASLSPGPSGLPQDKTRLPKLRSPRTREPKTEGTERWTDDVQVHVRAVREAGAHALGFRNGSLYL